MHQCPELPFPILIQVLDLVLKAGVFQLCPGRLEPQGSVGFSAFREKQQRQRSRTATVSAEVV